MKIKKMSSIEYSSKYGDKTWSSKISVYDQTIGETSLLISGDRMNIDISYGQRKGKFWCWLKETKKAIDISFPEDIEANIKILNCIIKDEVKAITIADGIKEHYLNYVKADIERTIYHSQIKKESNKISVILIDTTANQKYYLFGISKDKDRCILMTSPCEKSPICELHSPFISQLNYYYGHCLIDKDNKHLGVDYHKVKKELESAFENLID